VHSWHVYPKELRPGEYLSYYAEQYPIVEVDSTFYRSPSRKMVKSWRDKTPEGFGFSLKVPQTITHEKVLLDDCCCGAFTITAPSDVPNFGCQRFDLSSAVNRLRRSGSTSCTSCSCSFTRRAISSIASQSAVSSCL
jgi:uncharacterized protein YecE (DUF72 family)